MVETIIVDSRKQWNNIFTKKIKMKKKINYI